MLIAPLFYGLSRPAEHLTKYLTDTNFMGLENHLVYFGNAAISSIGLIVIYQYFSHTSDFVPKPNPKITFSEGYFG